MSRKPTFGLHIQRGAAPGFDYPIAQVQAARDSGLDAVWVADHLNGFPSTAPVFDPFVTMGYLAREASGLRIGMAATDPYRRHPALLAQSFMTVAAMTGRSPILTFGGGEAQNLTPYGWKVHKPLGRISKASAAIRKLWESGPDNTVTFSTDDFTLDNAFLQRPGDAPTPKIYLAANGPVGRKQIGREADGWVPMLLTPEMVAEDLADIHANAREAGRDPSEIEVVYHTSFALTEDSESGLERLKAGSARAAVGWPFMTKRLGYELPDTYHFWHFPVEKDTEPAIEAAAAEIPGHIFERTGIYGSADDCIRLVEEYFQAGVDHFVLRLATPLDQAAEFFRERLIPHVAARYGD